MSGVWFEEYERLWNEGEGEPDPAAVDAAVADRLGDIADRARDAWKERDL